MGHRARVWALIIAALDISSLRLDCCILADGQAPVLRHEILGKASDPLIERLRRVPRAVDMLLHAAMSWRSDELLWDEVDWVVIEQPAGRYGLQALLPLLGAITASVPSECQIAWRKASEWRHDLGAKNTKAAGHEAVAREIGHGPVSVAGDLVPIYGRDEHELDALGLGFGWRRLLEANAGGATP